MSYHHVRDFFTFIFVCVNFPQDIIREERLRQIRERRSTRKLVMEDIGVATPSHSSPSPTPPMSPPDKCMETGELGGTVPLSGDSGVTLRKIEVSGVSAPQTPS